MAKCKAHGYSDSLGTQVLKILESGPISSAQIKGRFSGKSVFETISNLVREGKVIRKTDPADGRHSIYCLPQDADEVGEFKKGFGSAPIPAEFSRWKTRRSLRGKGESLPG